MATEASVQHGVASAADSRLNARIPEGPIQDRWDNYKASMKLVAPGANRRKHTVIVQPGQVVRYNVTADAPGPWAYHCHMLYHMDAGMFREVVIA